ncbi:MAG: alkaline phosphatase PafA [Chitinophagaceae bacterium]
MKIFFAFFSLLLITISSGAQSLQRPKLVVGITVDQMRWDYLYRYYNRFAENGGFKRMLNKGFSCENTFIPYSPTVTACGHSTIFTGSVPAVHGITGNFWYDLQKKASLYCTGDTSVRTVGTTSIHGQQSPRNLLTTTITDELRLATNFQSKVIGIAIKDRGSILPAGHTANAAYWYDSNSGDWISSTYYMSELPKWLVDFNAQKLVNKYYAMGWNTLYPINTYTQSTTDENAYELKPLGAAAKGFPYNLSLFAGKSYGVLPATPFGDKLTIEIAKSALTNEKLGADAITDFLTISFSTPDYVGHSFGPNSIEVEDIYLRLDKELGEFLDVLDSKVGAGQYLVFLSADHGASHVTRFAKDHKIPAGNLDLNKIELDLNQSLKQKFGKDDLITTIANYQVVLNMPVIESSKLNIQEIKNLVMDYLSVQEGIDRVVDLNNLANTNLNVKIKDMLTNGYHPTRSGHIQLIPKPQWIEGYANGGTGHGVWNPYDAHIPLLWYGWGIKPGRLNREVYMTDIAPTVAALLHIQMPNGSVGNVIHEIIK